MKKILSSFLVLLFALVTAIQPAAAMLTVNELNGLNAGGAASPVVSTFIVNTSSTTDTASYSFASTSIGTAAADRFVVVGFNSRCFTDRSVTSVTIGGNTATQLAQVDPGASGFQTGLYGLLVTSGTTATIVVNFSGVCNRLGISVWTVTGWTSTTPNDTMTSTGVDPATGTIDVLDGGCIIAVASTLEPTTATWTGVTERFDAVIEAGTLDTGASDNFAVGQVNRTVTADFAIAGFAGSQRLAAIAIR